VSGRPGVRAAALAVLLGAAGAADAQLYRWRDPETGSVKLSTVPPPWYRGGVSSGPHVDMLLDGKLADPLTQRAAAAPPGAAGPLPPARVVPPGPGATHDELVSALVSGFRLREQFEAWTDTVLPPLEQELARNQVPASVRAAIREAGRAAFQPDRLQAHFVRAFSPEVSDADLREVIALEQLPLARRVRDMEASRGRRVSADPQAMVAAAGRAAPERRALAEAFEEAVQGTDQMAAVVAGAAAAVVLGAPDEKRAEVGETLQRRRAELRPALRETYVRAVLYIYEPLTDAEMRTLIELQKRPSMARVNRAVGAGFGAAVQESLTEFLAAARPALARR
jgi:hypothetical protein